MKLPSDLSSLLGKWWKHTKNIKFKSRGMIIRAGSIPTISKGITVVIVDLHYKNLNAWTADGLMREIDTVEFYKPKEEEIYETIRVIFGMSPAQAKEYSGVK
jgi:hypothetical protein